MNRALNYSRAFTAKGAILEGGRSPLFLAAAKAATIMSMAAVAAVTAFGQTPAKADELTEYSGLVFSIQSQIDQDGTAGRMHILDRGNDPRREAEFIIAQFSDLGLDNLQAYADVVTPGAYPLDGHDDEPICLIVGPDPSLTPEQAYAEPHVPKPQVDNVTKADFQRWEIWNSVGRCVTGNDQEAAELFATIKTAIDGSSTDFLNVLAVRQEIREWTSEGVEASSPNTRLVIDLIQNEEAFHELARMSLAELMSFASDNASRIDTRVAFHSGGARRLNHLESFLRSDPLTREFPAPYLTGPQMEITSFMAEIQRIENEEPTWRVSMR